MMAPTRVPQAPGEPKFKIAIIGSGPVGKLLACSVRSHPRIAYEQFESDKLPLRPSFGYGVGPQTLHTAKVLHPKLGQELYDRCYLSEVWMNFYHGGAEDRLIAPVKVPEGRYYGRFGRQALLDLLDSYAPEGHKTQYEKQLLNIEKRTDGLLDLTFKDGSVTTANAVWGCDGMRSVCRGILEGENHQPAHYAGMVAYRGKVPSALVASQVGAQFVEETYIFLGVKGWHVLVFPIDDGEYLNIAAFAMEPNYVRKGRDHVVTVDEVLSYFPGRNQTVDKILKLVAETPGGPQRLELSTMGELQPLFNPDLCMINFGDAANGMLPHLAGSMSTGFIGATTFLHESLNPLLERLPADATNGDISKVLMDAAAEYDYKHRPLAQKLVDYTTEQGPLWSGGIIDVEELSRRPRFLWFCADYQK